MKRQLAPATLLFAAAVTLLFVSGSPNIELWAACLFAVPALVWLAGGPNANPVLLFILGICWLAIVCDVLIADLEGRTISDDFGAYSERAILYSLCAMLAMAFGMRCAKLLGKWIFAQSQRKAAALEGIEYTIDLSHLLIFYFLSAGLATILGILAWRVPNLTQPILALSLVRYVGIYLLAVTVVETRRGYTWLALVAMLEVATGMISFFAAYKEAIFVILIAFASARQKLNGRIIAFLAVAVMAVFYISVVWSAVKKDYREIMYDMTLEQKIAYMEKQYLSPDFDFQVEMVELFKRIGYTTYYSQILARQDEGIIAPDYNFYEKAVIHVLTPRILFPNKAVLDDSAITAKLLGIRIDPYTSIGVGYVAEAQIDFGFPGLLVPMWAIGVLLGMAAEYFMTRPVPLSIRQAFAVATLFNCFSFAADIDKAFGGFITGFLVMAVALKFGFPMIEPWLVGLPLRRKVYAVRTGR